MWTRVLFVLALFMGGAAVSQAIAADSLKQIEIVRLDPIENDTSGTVTYDYPYILRVYYLAADPQSVTFGINWGEFGNPQFPYPQELQSGQDAKGRWYQDFGTVYQTSGKFKVTLLFFGPGVVGTQETQFTISVPAKKMPKVSKSLRPRVHRLAAPTTREEQF